MNVLIVDDEPLAQERLAQLLGDEGVAVAGTAANGREAIDQVARLKPDLVFMDIRMPVMDGLEAAQHLRLLETPPRLIFCTAYDQHALEAFDASAIDYLVKPVRADRLREALSKAERFTAEGGTAQPLPDSEQRSHLCARVRGNLELIPLEDVICLHAEHKYVTVIYSDGEVLIEEPLKALEEEFADRFLRIHRNALVALNAIAGLDREDGQVLVKLHGTDRRLEVSRRNLPTVRKVIKGL
ncbi:MAG: LytTR family DNA-binding domain-containing protein [Pseudomonadota bacterium]